MNLQKIMLFLVVISFSNVLYSFATPWMPCQNIDTLAMVKEFTIDGCDSEICRFYPGQNVTGTLIFVSSVNSSSLTVLMKASIFCVDMNYTHVENDGCKSSGFDCPIVTESTVTYPLAVTIPGLCHEVKKSMAMLEMLDENGNHLVCLKIPTQICYKTRPKLYRKK
ncbi:hypothetical protein MXB_164 [Myxobolus squamalis]|nr:hypothetical protein MXB_164 [Myxobolus squamalis]